MHPGVDSDLGLVDRDRILGLQVGRREPNLITDVLQLHLFLEGFHALALDSLLLLLVYDDLHHLALQPHHTLEVFHLLLDPLRDLNVVGVVFLEFLVIKGPLVRLEFCERFRLDSGKDVVNPLDVLEDKSALEITRTMPTLWTMTENSL